MADNEKNKNTEEVEDMGYRFNSDGGAALHESMSEVAIGTMTSLPFSSLISGPLMACIEAQNRSNQVTLGYIQKLAFSKDGKSSRNMAVTFEFEYINNGRVQRLSIPLLTLVPINFITIQNVTIGFKAKIDVSSQITNSEIESEIKCSKDMAGAHTHSSPATAKPSKEEAKVDPKVDPKEDPKKESKGESKEESKEDAKPAGKTVDSKVAGEKKDVLSAPVEKAEKEDRDPDKRKAEEKEAQEKLSDSIKKKEEAEKELAALPEEAPAQDKEKAQTKVTEAEQEVKKDRQDYDKKKSRFYEVADEVMDLATKYAPSIADVTMDIIGKSKGKKEEAASYSNKKDSVATQESKYSVETTIDFNVTAGQGDMPGGFAKILEVLGSSVDVFDPQGELTVTENKVAPNVKIFVTYKDTRGVFDASKIRISTSKCTVLPKDSGLMVSFSESGLYTIRAGKQRVDIEVSKN